MDLCFIKKEEPVDYALILTNDSEELTNENDPHANGTTTDTYTIFFKEEPADDCDSSKECLNVEKFDDEMDENETSGTSDKDFVAPKKSTKLKSVKSTANQTFSCSKCPSSFRRKYLLNQHVKNHDNLRRECCQVCNKFFPKSALVFHALSHKEPPFICAHCGKEFNNKESFRNHSKIHREKIYECDTCHKRFLTKGRLTYHLEIHIEREKKFQCHLCEIRFFRKNTLVRHIRNIHNGLPQKRYKCSNRTCNRAFVNNDDLQRHMCDQPVVPVLKRCKASMKCLHCAKRFSSESKFHSHCSQHCPQCKKLLRDPFKMALHVQQNCPKYITYECDLCTLKKSAKFLIRLHFAKHHMLKESHKHRKRNPRNGEAAQTECDYCRQIFRFPWNRIRHMKNSCTFRLDYTENVATAPERLECDICGSAFAYKHGMVEHMRIMHSTKPISHGTFMETFTCYTNRVNMLLYSCCDGKYVYAKHVTTEKCKFRCKKCSVYFASFYSLLRHCAEHSVKTQQSLRHMEQCESCDRMFKWKKCVPKHLKRIA